MNRNLIIEEKNGMYTATFNRYNGHQITRKTFLLLPREAETARALLEAGDPYAIDNFCYNIG